MTSTLNLPTLVLNRNWVPLTAVTVKRSIKKVFAEKASIICPQSYNQFNIYEWMALPIAEDEPFVRISSARMKVPEIIINKYNKVPNRKVVFSRKNLWRRDGSYCQYCGVRPHDDEITVDHVVPKSRGGKSTFDNCVLACVDCNKRKANCTPEEAGMKLRKYVKDANGSLVPVFYKRPTVPKWSPIYCVKKQKLPVSWSKFLTDFVDDIYWNTELEEG